MLGLIGYEDSDEGEVLEDAPVNTQPENEASRPVDDEKIKAIEPAPEQLETFLQPQQKDAPSPSGPSQGPSMPSQEADESIEGSIPRRSSPYTSNRIALRNITLPPIPNFEIPDSPPGSPSLGASKKFARFLELKKQGIHFNEKLEKSSALKNPSLLQKLMDFAGIDEKDQYASALPDDLATPTSFPAWAYADQLNKTQQKIMKKREEEQAKKQREAVEFVPAAASFLSNKSATSGAARGAPPSAAERIMGGLDREKSRSPAIHHDGRRRDGGRTEGRKSRFRSRSRSPTRKRSRSR